MKIQREHIGNYSYEVGINSVADYSPFGVELDGRTIDNIFHHPSQNNGSQTPADTVEIYNNDFENPPATGSPYLSTEVTLDAHLSNTTWTSSTGAFTNYNSSGAGSGKSIAITTASADTAYLTLTMDVDSGYELDITSYSFAHRSSATGYDSYTLIVNGIEIGSGSIYVASSGSTLQSTGVVDVSNPISGQTGTVGVVLKLYGGTHGHSGTFKMDDFVLNGFVREENSGYSSSDYFVSRNHRYSFQNQEHHNEIRGKGNYINYKYRGYDPRVGRLDWMVDPLSGDYPFYSPYAFSGNRVLDAVELEGLEPSSVHVYFVNNEGEKTGEFHRTAGERENDMGHLGDDFFAVTLPFLNLKSSQFELYSNVVIIYNVDSEEIENVFESMVESPIGKPKPKKQEQTARESTNWEKNGPLGVIIGEENADRFRNWESENLSGKAPLPLRLFVKVLPGPSWVDAAHTMIYGEDMMSPERGEVTGWMDRYALPAVTIGAGIGGMIYKSFEILNTIDKVNTGVGVYQEVKQTIDENKTNSENP